MSELLGLPDHVFPFAGLALGWPAEPGVLNPRLPLAATVQARVASPLTPRSSAEGGKYCDS